MPQPDASWTGRLASVMRDTAPRSRPFGCDVHAYLEVTSTNDVAARLAAEGAPEGTVVVAAAQSKGRGRRGASFASPPGTGMYLSTILRPAAWPAVRRDPDGPPRVITLMAGVAVAEAARALGVAAAELKWPNDVIVRRDAQGGWRKLAGVLTEASADTQGLTHVIVGIGMNVSAVPASPHLADVATSVCDVTGRDPGVESAVAAVMTALARWYHRLAHEGATAVVEAWRTYAPSMPGRRVSWQEGSQTRTGRVHSLDRSGALCVATPEGLAQIVAGTLAWDSDAG